jgi:hypothetical protein
MVYNVSYTPTDMAGIFGDLFAEFLKNGILYAGVIVLAVIIILIIRALRK